MPPFSSPQGFPFAPDESIHGLSFIIQMRGFGIEMLSGCRNIGEPQSIRIYELLALEKRPFAVLT